MKYEIIGRFIELHEGLIEVSESQAKRRMQSLAPVGGGVYRIDNPVQFKVGEVIGLNYNPPKSLVEFMLPLDEISDAKIEAVEEVTESLNNAIEELPKPATVEIRVKQKHKR